MLPWIIVLVAVAVLLTSINMYQERKNQDQLWQQQAQQSTIALRNHFLSTKDQIENIALIIQFSQQTQDMPLNDPDPANQALNAYQYMQFLNTVKLGYPVVGSIWIIRDGYALSSDRTRYQLDAAALPAALKGTPWSGWLYPFYPQRAIGRDEKGTGCLTYVAPIWNTAENGYSIVAIHVNAAEMYRMMLDLSGLESLAIMDSSGRAVLSDPASAQGPAVEGGTRTPADAAGRPYVSVSEDGYTFFGAVSSAQGTDDKRLRFMTPFLFFVFTLGGVIVVCYAISKRIWSPLSALIDRFQANSANMDDRTTMIVQKSLDSMMRHDYLAREESSQESIAEEYQKLMDDIITPQMIESLQVMEQYVILTMEIDEPEHQNGNAERLMPYFERFVRSCLRNMVEKDERIYTVYVHDRRVAAVVTLDTPARFGEVDRMMSSLQEMLQAVSPCSVSIACSNLHSDQAEIRDAMAEALEAIRWKLMRHPGCHIFYCERESAASRFIFPKAKLLSVLSSLDKEELNRVLDKYHDFVSTVINGGASVDDLMLAYYQMLGLIIQQQLQRGIPSGRIFMETADSPYRYMSSLEFSDHISEWLEKKIGLLWEQSQTTNAAGNVYINSFRDYMQKHYMDDLQPESVAAEMGISYSYLRRLLSKELNTSFSVYLLTLRLTQSKELLRTTQLPLKDIAEQSGFRNEQTLYRVFRQNEGCSPREWRRTAMASLSNMEPKNMKEGD